MKTLNDVWLKYKKEFDNDCSRYDHEVDEEFDEIRTIRECEHSVGHFSEDLRDLAKEWIKTINSEEIIEKGCPACEELGNRFIWKKNGCPIIFTKSEGFEIIEILKELFDLTESDL